MSRVLFDVELERECQDAKWGQQNHPDGTGRPGARLMADHYRRVCQAHTPETDNWQDILSEEVYEAYAETDPVKLRAELVQVAAVAVAWVEAIDRRRIASLTDALRQDAGPFVAEIANSIPKTGRDLGD